MIVYIKSSDGMLGIEVARKKGIKNINLSVKPPDGRTVVSAPLKAGEREITKFLESKAEWIVAHRNKIILKAKNAPPEPRYLSGEEINIFGKKYILEVEAAEKFGMSYIDGRAVMKAPPDGTAEQRQACAVKSFKALLTREAGKKIAYWEEKTQLKCSSWSVVRMKSRWGSCNVKTKKIRLSLMLVHKPPECLDYVIVHELTHFVTRYHDAEFYSHMEKFYPESRKTAGLLKDK
ncbi:MAG: M48 family metallopeptidase [Clostridiales bacterium]|jgi:predicted metal-dependent hydrolase|nr:M48 family metallopeptidase [Clostridiales bacterium]